MSSHSIWDFSNVFPDLWASIVNGFHFFFDAFGDLFSNTGVLSFIMFFLFCNACFGALTCVLGLIGSGITTAKISIKNSKRG